MIIVTDAHISKTRGNQTPFFRMLASFEGNGQELIFLGDIFDLWIALDRYENDIHRDFAAWCRKEKSRRTIGFMEGNHEYYLAEERISDFTWCTRKSWQRDEAGLIFAHGDQINLKDLNYLRFRKLAKNRFSKFIIRHLPFGPELARMVKREIKKTNSRFRVHMPHAEIQSFAEARFAEGIEIIFMGHFHREQLYRNGDGKKLYLLPDWFSTQKITVYDRITKQVRHMQWEALRGETNKKMAPA